MTTIGMCIDPKEQLKLLQRNMPRAAFRAVRELVTRLQEELEDALVTIQDYRRDVVSLNQMYSSARAELAEAKQTRDKALKDWAKESDEVGHLAIELAEARAKNKDLEAFATVLAKTLNETTRLLARERDLRVQAEADFWALKRMGS